MVPTSRDGYILVPYVGRHLSVGCTASTVWYHSITEGAFLRY